MRRFALAALLCSQMSFAVGFEFHGYWRAGFNTGISPLQTPDDVDGQGGINAHTSRHIRSPNYYRLTFVNSFESGMRVEAGFDSPSDNPFPHANGNWQSEAFRVRDLFVELPIDGENKLWAGSRRFEYEDVRLFDFIPFGFNAFGVGGDFSFGTLALSAADDAQIASKRKNIDLMYRLPLALNASSKIIPTVIVSAHGRTRAGAVPASATTPATAFAARKAYTDVKGGAVYSYGTGDTWANVFVVASTETEEAETIQRLNKHFQIAESGQFPILDDLQIVTALSLDLWNYSQARTKFKLQDGALVAGTGTSKTKRVVSVGAQPVYFITDRVHAALDLNAVHHIDKVTANDSNAVFVTPIMRYAFARNSLGTPQIYTSVTYGKYEAKLKENFKGEASNRLISTQTGFEVWF